MTDTLCKFFFFFFFTPCILFFWLSFFIYIYIHPDDTVKSMFVYIHLRYNVILMFTMYNISFLVNALLLYMNWIWNFLFESCMYALLLLLLLLLLLTLRLLYYYYYYVLVYVRTYLLLRLCQRRSSRSFVRWYLSLSLFYFTIPFIIIIITIVC